MEAAKYLDAARLDKFNAEFLAATLTTEPGRWQSYEDLLRQTSASRDPLAVLKLVELYEATENSELREFLGQVLLMRSSGNPPGRSVEEVAAFVRQGLGITDVPRSRRHLDQILPRSARSSGKCQRAAGTDDAVAGRSVAIGTFHDVGLCLRPKRME